MITAGRRDPSRTPRPHRRPWFIRHRRWISKAVRSREARCFDVVRLNCGKLSSSRMVSWRRPTSGETAHVVTPPLVVCPHRREPRLRDRLWSPPQPARRPRSALSSTVWYRPVAPLERDPEPQATQAARPSARCPSAAASTPVRSLTAVAAAARGRGASGSSLILLIKCRLNRPPWQGALHQFADACINRFWGPYLSALPS
jgi:hypothetical protein